jgi:O-antigen/teichoic acid export membrane protein
METRASAPDTPLGASSEAADRTSGASVVRGGIWSAASATIPQFFTLAVSVAGARFLGPSGLGRQSFIAFVCTSSINLFGYGLQISLMRAIGEAVGAGRGAEARGLFRWGARLSPFGAGASCTALLIAAFMGAQPKTAWILAAATAALGVVTAIPGAALAGLQRWRDIAIVTLGCSAGGAALTIGVLAAGGGVTGMIAAQLVTSTGIFLGVAALARRRLRAVAPAPAALPRALRRHTLRYAASAFAGSLVTLIVFRRSEFFFLQHWWNDRQTALYSVAFSAATTLVLVPQALANALSPAVATLLGAGQLDRIRTGYSRSLRLLLIASLPIAAGGLALGPETVRLIFGPGFAGTSVPLLVLLAPLPLLPLMALSYSLAVGLGKIRFPLVVGAGSAVLNVGLDLALIPPHAAVGAAIANASAQGATAVATVAYGVRLMAPVRWEAATLARGVAAAALAGGAAWGALALVGGGPGVVAGLVAGIAVFAVSAARLRILPRQDADWLEQSFGRLIGGRLGAAARVMAAAGAGQGLSPPPSG